MKKRKKGRPTKFREEFIERAAKYASIGLSYKDIAWLLSEKDNVIAEQQIKDWVRRKKNFATTIYKGQTSGKATIIKSIFDMATGGNLNAATFWLCNRYSEEWINTSRTEIKGVGKDGAIVISDPDRYRQQLIGKIGTATGLEEKDIK